MNYYLIIDNNTNEGVYVREDKQPFVDINARLFQSFDDGETYVEVQPTPPDLPDGSTPLTTPSENQDQ